MKAKDYSDYKDVISETRLKLYIVSYSFLLLYITTVYDMPRSSTGNIVKIQVIGRGTLAIVVPKALGAALCLEAGNHFRIYANGDGFALIPEDQNWPLQSNVMDDWEKRIRFAKEILKPYIMKLTTKLNIFFNEVAWNNLEDRNLIYWVEQYELIRRNCRSTEEAVVSYMRIWNAEGTCPFFHL